jgi:hypothetical protein
MLKYCRLIHNSSKLFKISLHAAKVAIPKYGRPIHNSESLQFIARISKLYRRPIKKGRRTWTCGGGANHLNTSSFPYSNKFARIFSLNVGNRTNINAKHSDTELLFIQV